MLLKRYSWIALMTLVFLAFGIAACGDSDGETKPGDETSYDVSGKVVGENDEGISGITIGFGGAADAVTSDTDGVWKQSGLQGSVEITPQSSTYDFEPKSQTVSKASDDIVFVATSKAVAQDPYNVSGYVFDAYDAPLANVTLSFSDGTAAVQTDGDGSWQAENLQGEVEITPSLAGYSFEPTSETVIGAADDLVFVGSEVEPLVVEVSPQSHQLVPSGTVALEATLSGTFANDAELAWSLSPEEGALSSAEGEQVTYTAGSNAGTVEITVTATTDDESASATATIEVSALAVNIEASKTTVGFDETVNLTAEVAGAGAESAIFIWSATSGVLDGTTGSSVGWKAPSTIGTYTITVVVQANSQNAEASVDIAVQDPLCIGIENCTVIRTVQELQAMQAQGNHHYVLGNDIHASESETWNSGKGFEPIGDDDTRFDGTFDGNDFQIVGLSITRPQEDHVGLFGVTASSATVHDVTIVDWNVKGRDDTGTLVGANYGDLISIALEGVDVEGADRTGGLVGDNRGLIQNLTNENDGLRVAGQERVGGIAGFNVGTIRDFQLSKRVTADGERQVGGVAGAQGRFSDGTTNSIPSVIQDGYVTTGTLEATADVGGIVGRNGTSSSLVGGAISWGTIGDISDVRVKPEGVFYITEGSAGGAVGAHLQGNIERVSVVSDHAAQGAIHLRNATGTGYLGGFVGQSRSTIKESYIQSKFLFGPVIHTGAGGTSVGGNFVGLLSGGNIENCYSDTNIFPGTHTSGGFAGEIAASGTLQRVYSKVHASTVGNNVQTVGGLVAKNTRSDAVAFSYWDEESSGQTTSAGGSGLTTTNMGRSMSFNGWDFQNIWKITDGLPDLQNNLRD